MANLTNSGKLISKIEGIDSSISSIEEKLGTVPAGTDIMEEIGKVDEKIGTLPTGKTAAEAIADAAQDAADVASDLSDFESEVADTYATKDSVASAFLYKGTVSTYANLPASGNKTGDVWNVETADASHDLKAGDNVVWNGSAWDVLSGIVDLSNYYTKTQVDGLVDGVSDDVTTLAGRVTTAEGKITTLEGKMTTAEGDIDALEGRMDTAEGDIDAVEGRLDTAESDIDALETASGNRYTKTEINTMTGLSSANAGFVSNTVAEGNDGKVTVTAADNKTVAQAESNNKAAIAALGTAHNNVIDRLEALEEDAGDNDPTKWIDVTFNNSKTASVSDTFITAATCVDTWVVKTGTAASYAYEYEVEAGKITFTASNNESITLRVRLIKEYVAA